VKCCTVPGRSQNLTSTNSTLLSPMNFSTSSAFVNINPPWRLRPGPGRAGCAGCRTAVVTLGASRFRVVSQVFHACYAGRLARSRCAGRVSRASPGGRAVPWGWVRLPGGQGEGSRPGVSGREVRAAETGPAVGGEHGPPAGRAAHRLVRLHADLAGRIPLAVPDAGDLRGRGLPAHRA